jgi:hypothetical protein
LRNTSQDPDYEGLPYHEKKFHKTHFEVRGLHKKMYDFSQDPDYYQVKPGVWRKKQENQKHDPTTSHSSNSHHRG